jgi:hypothetical protein
VLEVVNRWPVESAFLFTAKPQTTAQIKAVVCGSAVND